MPSSDQIVRDGNGVPQLEETVAVTTTAAYGAKVVFPGEVIRLVPTANMDVRFCKEYVYGSRLGDDVYEEPATDIFEADAQDEEIDDTKFWQKSVTTNEAILDKDGTPTMGKTRSLQLNLADQDDVFRCFFTSKSKKNRTPQLWMPQDLPISQTLQLSVSHLDGNASNPMQYQLRCEIGGAQVYWNGTSWTTASWIDITGSATLATFTDAVTSHTTLAPYSIAFRSKADAAVVANIGWFGLHETVVIGTNGVRLSQDVEYKMVVPYRARLGAIMAAGTGTLYIDKVG